MTPDTVSQTVLFPDLFDKPLVATFDEQHASSDGGGILLKAAERVYGLVKAFAGCLTDKRAPEKIRHTLADVIGQRIFGIACGHPDGNDADHLADDPIHKLLLGRDPVTGARLASQPTISRFENDVRRSALYRMGRELAACVIERHRRRLHGRARRITIDLDPTDDRTHGAQQLTFFNGHYGAWCYLPQLAFLTFDREVEQYLCAAVLRPGKAVASDGAIGLLRRLLPLLRAAFPRVRFLVRLDGGFATPELFDFLDAEPRLDYVVAMAKNAVLVRRAEPAMEVARAQSEVSGKTAHVYTDTRYAARTWDGARRVVIKAEVVRLGDRAPRDNPRFVVTNMRQTPRFIYEKVYCARGDIENRIKELLDGLQIDRTSCTHFSANQLRVLLTAAAYVLSVFVAWDCAEAGRGRGVPGAGGGQLPATPDDLRVSAAAPGRFQAVVRRGGRSGSRAGPCAVREAVCRRDEGAREREQAQGDELRSDAGGGTASVRRDRRAVAGGGRDRRGRGRAVGAGGAGRRVAGGVASAGRSSGGDPGGEGAFGGGAAGGGRRPRTAGGPGSKPEGGDDRTSGRMASLTRRRRATSRTRKAGS